MVKFLVASLGCPLFLLFYICHQAFRRGVLMGAVLARDLSLHTHAHLNIHKHTQMPDTHTHTQTHTHRHIQRGWTCGIGCRVRVWPSGMPAEGCGLTPLAVCVAVSHGKHCSPGELWPEGDVMGQDVFPVVRFNHVCGHARRPAEEILSTPWPLHLVGVSSGVAQPQKNQLLHHETVYLYVIFSFTF